MARHRDLLDRVLHGASDANIAFGDLRLLLLGLGFAERVRGEHFIFSKDGVAEILNLQPKGALAKPYQVKQVRGVIVRYKLSGDERAG
ncbi:MAG: type II toxin-antitoxin system HicA family toxin [Ardenticatenales bacterium]